MYEYRKITEREFWSKISKKESDFSHYDIDFEIDFKDIKEIDFELNFSKTIFRKSVKFRRTVYHKYFILAGAVFESSADFFGSEFRGDFSAHKAVFQKNTSFNMVKFYEDVDFNKTKFKDTVYFKKARFIKNVFFQKTFFHRKADFSYAHFSKYDISSFVSINENKITEEINHPPLFIFKNILFSSSVVFNDVDLSRVVFQDSIIEDIVFKECIFPKIDGRNAFYLEKPKIVSAVVDEDFDKIKNEELNTLIFTKDQENSRICLSDRIVIKDKKTSLKETFFVVTKFYFNSLEEALDSFQEMNKKRMYIGVQDINPKICIKNVEGYEGEVVALRVKKFVPEKHGEVLEDLYRQMKKSLEDSRDWQMAGDFYKGEMNAKMHLLKERKEQSGYVVTLGFYKFVSYFGESITRILSVVFISGFLGTLLMKLFMPAKSWLEVSSINVSLYMPIFGSNTTTISSLNLKPGQEIIVYGEVAGFYFMGLILAIALRRRFRR